MPTIREQRDALLSALTTQIGAGTVGSMTQAQLLNQAALHIMLDKVASTDPMVADAAALLSATTAAELEDMLIQEDAQDAYDAAVNDADIRAEILANGVARAAIAGSTRAVQRLTNSTTFNAFLANADMRSALFGSSTARAAILASTGQRGSLLSASPQDNFTPAIADSGMRSAIYADATARGEVLASSALMDILWANATARDAAFNDATVRAAVIASTNAFTRLMANATARQAAWGNANMPAVIAASAACLGIIDDTQAHMDEVLSSTYSTMRGLMISAATARGAIVASAAWMKRAANAAGFLALALADGTFLTAWRASAALTARELPTMTTTDANMTASSESSASWAAWKAADSDTTSAWLASSAPPGWIKYDFGSGKSVNVHQMVLQAGTNRKPNAWTLEGSNDNSAWTSVATGNMTNNTSQQLVNVAHSAGYRYFRWTVSSVHSGGTPGIADFDLKGFEVQ